MSISENDIPGVPVDLLADIKARPTADLKQMLAQQTLVQQMMTDRSEKYRVMAVCADNLVKAMEEELFDRKPDGNVFQFKPSTGGDE
jgi:hypothetical protein